MTPRVCFLFAIAFGLAGCGGSGGGSVSPGTASFVTAKIPIGWAQRAREFSGPASALSVVVTIDDAGTSKQNVTLEEDRSTSPGAYTQTYTTSLPVQMGIESIHVRFYSQAGGLGNIVAQSDASVTVRSDGTIAKADGSALGSVQATGNIVSVHVYGPSQVAAGSASNITTTAFDGAQNVISVSPGSISYQITGDAGAAAINSSGQISGISAGGVLLTATIDGIVSGGYPVTITPPLLTMTSLTQPTNGMVFDAQTGHLWATVPATASSYANSVIEIDPVTEHVVSHISVGSNPTVIAISDDGTTLYVGLQGSDSFARVDPVGKTVVATYPINSQLSNNGSEAQYAISIAVQPGNPDVVALAQQDEGDSGFNGGCIYNLGVLLPNQLGIYNGGVLVFSNSSTLWGSDPDFSPESLFRASVDSTGATMTSTNSDLGGNFSIYGGNLYFTNGQVVSGTNGNLLGTFPSSQNDLGLTSGYGVGVTVDLTNHVAYIVRQDIGGTSGLTVNSFNTTNFTSVATYAVPDGPAGAQGFVLLPSGGFAFEDGTNIYFLGAPSGSSVKKKA